MSKYEILCGLESLSSKILIDMESKEQTFNGRQMKRKKIKEVGQNSFKLSKRRQSGLKFYQVYCFILFIDQAQQLFFSPSLWLY